MTDCLLRNDTIIYFNLLSTKTTALNLIWYAINTMLDGIFFLH